MSGRAYAQRTGNCDGNYYEINCNDDRNNIILIANLNLRGDHTVK